MLFTSLRENYKLLTSLYVVILGWEVLENIFKKIKGNFWSFFLNCIVQFGYLLNLNI